MYGLVAGVIFIFLPSWLEPWGKFTEFISQKIGQIFPWIGDGLLATFLIYCVFATIVWLIIKLATSNTVAIGAEAFSWKEELKFYILGLTVVLILFSLTALIAISQFKFAQ